MACVHFRSVNAPLTADFQLTNEKSPNTELGGGVHAGTCDVVAGILRCGGTGNRKCVTPTRDFKSDAIEKWTSQSLAQRMLSPSFCFRSPSFPLGTTLKLMI